MEPIIRAIHDELVLSYTQAGRVVPSTVAIVAQSLRDALGFEDEREVHVVFSKARDMADVPTQRVLKEALLNYRQEHKAYIEHAPDVPRISHPGLKRCTNAETKYIMATQRLAGIYPYMDEDKARKIKAEFEADPKNREMVDYQRGWINNFIEMYKETLKKMKERGWL